MDFLAQISTLVFLNLFSIYRLIFMATMYTLNKDVKLGQFRIYEGEFPDRLRSARQLYQNMFELHILFYSIHINWPKLFQKQLMKLHMDLLDLVPYLL